jgi:DNA polymerase-3 subunit gamma/tau
VAGQSVIKSILSRAALEDRIAPAYIFSGTRGVGKTTLARIFAKAVNCRRAPGAEPCNECDQCRAITLGSSVDVVEMDGASNTGVDDVRKLKEIVGYAPMEGRYKIFIIDEAHMLSKNAFNALLKTLEEPPPRVTFILATTEPHKFPATIISRCQHYVFKSLSEKELIAHLCAVLQSESVEYEETATRLIARRGAGSVRDSLSLLDQVLALGGGSLTENSVRNVLGLAGMEMQRAVLSAIRDGDCLRLSSLLGELLDQGLDMGFFLRELSGIWRDLFILKQSGAEALPVLDLPQTEADACLELCRGFSLPQIHACWQMTLEGQRRVRDSLEPASALELLLLNLAMLPRLLALENITAANGIGAQMPASLPEAARPEHLPEAPAPASPAPDERVARLSEAESGDTEILPTIASLSPPTSARPDFSRPVLSAPTPDAEIASKIASLSPPASARPDFSRPALSVPAPASGESARNGKKKIQENRQARTGEKQADKFEIMKNTLVQEVIRRFDASYLDHGRR